MTRSLLGLAAFLYVVAGSAGCTEAPAPGPVGYLDIALTAPGSGGATYHLPRGTRLNLSAPPFDGFFPLDGDAPSLTVMVPPGDYTVNLFDDAGDTSLWPLVRQNADGTTETVPATLELPSTVHVAQNQTTPLVLRFHVTGSTITFGRGSVAVTVEVDETLDFGIFAPTLTIRTLQIGATAPAALVQRLPTLGDMGDRFALRVQTIGSRWVALGSNRVCIDATASLEGGGSQGFTDLVAEVLPSDRPPLCIQQLQPHVALLEMDFGSLGKPKTPLFSGLDLGDLEVSVSLVIEAAIDADLYDGTTLHLEALSGDRPASIVVDGAIFAGVPSDIPTVLDSWYQMNDDGDGTSTLTPF